MPRSRPPAASAVAGPSGTGQTQVQPVVGYWRHGNPPGRAGHTAVLYNDSIVCFGGHLGENLCSSEVLSYHLKKREWKLHTGLEPGPCERDGHTAVLWEHGMYIFGGETTGTNEEYLNDLWHLDLRTCRWAPVTSLDDSPPPCPRRGHAAVVAKNCMYIVAGHTTTGERLNDVHTFNFDTMAWSEVSSYEKIAPDKPQPRSGHSCVAVDDRELVIFGGCHQSPYRLNDTWRFDIHKKSWSSVLGQGDVPPARSEHTAAVIDKSMVIFGGWISDDHVPTALTAALNLETGAWQTVHCKEEFHPPDVADHAGVAWNRGLYVFGGYRNVEQPIEFLTVFELALGASGSEDSCSMPQKMQTDMLRSVGRDQFSDIRLVVAGGVQVPAHRVVLAARSEYFRALFDGDMSDSKAPSVSLTTLSQEVALVVLRFMYGGVVEVPPELLLEVLAAANMLLLDELKAECEVRLTKSVTVDNCCALLQSADVHEARSLRSHCLSFAVQEYEAVVQGQGYADLLEAAPPLMLELQRALVPRLRTMSAITSMQRGRKRRHSEVES